MTNSIFSLILCSLSALCVIDIDFVWVANPILAEGNTNYIPLNSRDGVGDREKTTTTQTKPKSQTMEYRFFYRQFRSALEKRIGREQIWITVRT